MSEMIRVNQEGGVLEISFARPEKKNAITNEMYRTICAEMQRASGDKSVRVLLFSSEGKDFTAGNDLADFLAVSSGGEIPAAIDLVSELCGFEKPIVAAAPGLAVGIGATMLFHCDLVFVTESTKLITPFVNLGLVPENASSLLMPARIGYARAFAMFALGEPMSGTEAHSIGVANKLLPADELLPTARAVAAKLAAQPIGSVIATKRLMRDSEAIRARADVESAIFGQRLSSDEAREAFSAFLERRKPDFSKF